MTEQFTKPATLEDLKRLISSLNQQDADYLLIGGYALFAHGYHRATEDIDLLVPPTYESGNNIRNALMILPDQAAADRVVLERAIEMYRRTHERDSKD